MEGGYGFNQFVIGCPLQVVVGQSVSVNTLSGDLLMVSVSHLDGFGQSAGRIFVYRVVETITELRKSGVQVLD